MTTTTEPAHGVPPRLTKHDRVALGAIRIAAALPGRWTVGRGRTSDQVADLLCLDTGFRIGLVPWDRRAWGYHLVPGPVPPRLREVFMWPWPHGPGEDDYPGFAVRTPAAEVAAYIHDVFVPAYRQALARAETDRPVRDQAHARGQAARDRVATQLLDEITSVCRSEKPRRVKPVAVRYWRHSDLIEIQLTLPVDDAIARAPALARALGAPVDDTAPPATAAERPNQNDRNGKGHA
ncbi:MULTISPECIES: hypothetical protein [Amycolatopsis]|uniref:Uncharacterized protein n=1 Tax=Amycolatopsis albidoflavus TaxID=102226 RepID=A0ABW5IFB2_9PSEU